MGDESTEVHLGTNRGISMGCRVDSLGDRYSLPRAVIENCTIVDGPPRWYLSTTPRFVGRYPDDQSLEMALAHQAEDERFFVQFEQLVRKSTEPAKVDIDNMRMPWE